MNISEHYGFNLPSYSDTSDIEKLSDNFKTTDKELYRQKLIDDNLERDKVETSAFNAHKIASILDHPDNSVTDTKIGERSVGATKGLLQPLFTAIANVITAIVGGTEWNSVPDTTLKSAKLHMDSKINPHGTTKAQVGLGNADNTSDADKPVSTAQAAAIKTVQNDVTAHKANAQNPHATTAEQVGTYTKAAIDAKDKAINDAATVHYSDNDRHINSGERPKWNDKYTKSEVDNKFSMLETNTDWKESVSTFADIAKTYPTPQDGWTVNTRDTDYTYRYSGTNWVVISANAIPKATASIDGLQTKENVAEVTANTANRHNHNNKAVLDVITNVLINTWNTVTEKLNLSGGTLTGDLILNAAPTANLQAATKKYVDDIASGKGNGDMLKTVYDANNDGIVDNAALLGGLSSGEFCRADDSRLSDARPANGGNANTLDSLDSTAFAKARNITLAELNSTNLTSGIYNVENVSLSTVGLPGNFAHIFVGGDYSRGGGCDAQIAIPYYDGAMNGVWYRVANGGTDPTFRRIDNYNNLVNKPQSLPASDVYTWAKQSTKPSYSASEVGALPIGGTAVAANSIDGGTY